jgi:hypothetical protein
MAKIKVHELRSKSKTELLNQVCDFSKMSETFLFGPDIASLWLGMPGLFVFVYCLWPCALKNDEIVALVWDETTYRCFVKRCS